MAQDIGVLKSLAVWPVWDRVCLWHFLLAVVRMLFWELGIFNMCVWILKLLGWTEVFFERLISYSGSPQ